MPQWPNHRYLGPGNPAYNGDPVDEDDRIAQRHDIAYEQQPDDVSDADKRAVDEFTADWQRTWNVHSLVGAVGIQAKRTVEGLTGQLYPMSAHSHGGRADYAAANKELSKRYQQQKALGIGAALSWRDYQKAHFGNILREQSKLRREQAERDSAGPAEKQRKSGDDNADRVDTVDESGPSTSTDNNQTGGAMDVDSMETIANPSSGGGVVTSGARGGGGHSGKGGAGGTMIVGIPRTPKTEYVTKTFRKSWCFFSYGAAWKVLKEQNDLLYCTSLMLVPVDMLPFYMDPAEFSALASSGRVVAVNCRAGIRTLGCRMNFQTGASESKWATSEFVAIGQTAIGINLCMPGYNKAYTFNATSQMKVDSVSNPTYTNLDDKLYGGRTGGGSAQCIPRHMNMYWVPVTADNNTAATGWFGHSNGAPKIDQYVERFLVNTAVGQPLINYEYKPKNGVIVDTYLCDYNNHTQKYRATSNSLITKFAVTEPTNATEGQLLLKYLTSEQESDVNDWKNQFTSSYWQNIEHHDCYDMDRGHVTRNVQPQVHVGLTAVPAINPAKDNADFQNTAIYWAIDCELTVHEYENSCFHYGNPHTYNPRFYPKSYTKKYGTGNAFNHHANLASPAWETRYDDSTQWTPADEHLFAPVIDGTNLQMGDSFTDGRGRPRQHAGNTDVAGSIPSYMGTNTALQITARRTAMDRPARFGTQQSTG